MVREFADIYSALRREHRNTNGITTISSYIRYKYVQYWDHLLREQYAEHDEEAFVQEDTLNIHIHNLQEFIDFYRKESYMAIKYAVFARHFVFLDWLLVNYLRETITFCDRISNRTLLHFAVLNGDLLKVQCLLKHGIDVNKSDCKGRTAMYMSLNEPRHMHPYTIIEELLINGADINQKTHSGFSVLHRACLMQDAAMIEFLIKKRAIVYTLDKKLLLPIEYYKGDQQELKNVLNQNIRFCGKKEHTKMWAHIMSKSFVKSLLVSIQPLCSVCKRKMSLCSALRKDDYRYWLHVHHRFDNK